MRVLKNYYCFSFFVIASAGAVWYNYDNEGNQIMPETAPTEEIPWVKKCSH